MLVVVTPAASSRLTTAERVNEEFGASLPTERLNRYIDQASAAIVDWCRRPFALETVAETFDRFCSVGPLLARAPVVEILAVMLDGGAVPTADYRFDAETGRLQRVADGGHAPWYGVSLSVQYRAGYLLPSDANNAPEPTLPASVERAAIRLVGAYLSAASRDPLVKTDTTEGVGSTSWWVPGANSVLADPEAEQLLAPFRRLF